MVVTENIVNGLHMPTRVSKFVGIFLAVCLLTIVVGLARLWWASLPPKFPKNLSPNSVWITNIMVPRFSFVPRGVWVSCWLETQRNVDRCEFSDYKGMVWHQDDYTSCDDSLPVPDARLQLRNHDQSTAFVFLRDGTVLFPVSFCAARKHRANPLQAPSTE